MINKVKHSLSSDEWLHVREAGREAYQESKRTQDSEEVAVHAADLAREECLAYIQLTGEANDQ